MPKKDKKILKYNHGEKSKKAPSVIYADIESSHKKINTCHNNPEKSATTKISNHTTYGCSLFTCCSFDVKENTPNCYRG